MTRLTLDRYLGRDRRRVFYVYFLAPQKGGAACGFIQLEGGFYRWYLDGPDRLNGRAVTLLGAWDAAEAAYNEREGDAA